MPVPKPVPHYKVTLGFSLKGPGVAMLVRYGAELSPPKPEEAIPGIRCTQHRGKDDVVLMEAVGYGETPTDPAGHTAIARAAQACIDAGLGVFQPEAGDSLYPARIVRRRK